MPLTRYKSAIIITFLTFAFICAIISTVYYSFKAKENVYIIEVLEDNSVIISSDIPDEDVLTSKDSIQFFIKDYY